MTAAVIAPADLSWVTFSGEDSEPCAATELPCALEAVVRAVWSVPCSCWPNPQPLCCRHRDRLLAKVPACYDGWWRCRGCGTLSRLLRLEPVR